MAKTEKKSKNKPGYWFRGNMMHYRTKSGKEGSMPRSHVKMAQRWGLEERKKPAYRKMRRIETPRTLKDFSVPDGKKECWGTGKGKICTQNVIEVTPMRSLTGKPGVFNYDLKLYFDAQNWNFDVKAGNLSELKRILKKKVKDGSLKRTLIERASWGMPVAPIPR